MIDTALLLAEDVPRPSGLRVIALKDRSELRTSFNGNFAPEPVRYKSSTIGQNGTQDDLGSWGTNVCFRSTYLLIWLYLGVLLAMWSPTNYG